MLKFLHWYINKAVDLTIYLYKSFVDYNREDYTGYMVGVCLVGGITCLLVSIMTGLGSLGRRHKDNQELAQISLAFTLVLVLLPLIGVLLPLLVIITILCFIVYLIITAFDLRDSISLEIFSNIYYKLRDQYLKLKSKMKARAPIEKQNTAYRSNSCPACSREYNK